MRTRYHFALEVKCPLSDDEKDELRREMVSGACAALCDIFRGDSGDVSLKYCDPPKS